MKLTSTLNTTNMHLHNIDGNIKKYNDINEILKEYYNIRLIYYDHRRSYLLEKFKKDTSILNSKIKFIEGIINKSINIFNKTKNEINHILANYNPPFPYDNGNYDYLTNMRIYTFSKEKINDLKHQYEKLMEEYTILQSKTPIDIWKNDLSNFVKTYKKTDNNDIIKSKIKGKGKAK
jgi:DNA topoisomerase-2